MNASSLPTTTDDNAWFDEARFGLFIHWGIYSLLGGEWRGHEVPSIGEWILKNAQIPVADYVALAKDFTASGYDPAFYAALARRAGMKYVVITTKHHDGFALYDSAVSDWNVTASAAGRDLIGPLAEAVRREGLRFGAYYSQSQDWVHPGGAVAMGSTWDPQQAGDYDVYLRETALAQVRELIERYDPSILWWDTPVDMTPERARPFAELLAEHPRILSNDRLGGGVPGDTITPEQHIPPRGYPGKRFEVCMTMNDTWGFKKNDHNWKSVRQLLRNLSDIASKGGNFLLNVGPTAEGEIPPESVERLEAIGRWMDVNGEAIHGTQAGPFPRRLSWGRVTRKTNVRQAVWYLHVWDWPPDGRILLPTVDATPVAARLLGGEAAISWKPSPEGLVLLLEGRPSHPDVSVVRVEFTSEPSVTQSEFVPPDVEGRIRLSPLDADAHGHWDGNIQLKEEADGMYLGDWRKANWFLSYQLHVPKAGLWTLQAEVMVEAPVRVKVVVNGHEKQTFIQATGAEWKVISLEGIDLPKGDTRMDVRAVEEGWTPLSVRHLTLIPVRALS